MLEYYTTSLTQNMYQFAYKLNNLNCTNCTFILFPKVKKYLVVEKSICNCTIFNSIKHHFSKAND